MQAQADEIFTRLVPILNVSDLAAERAFYASLGLPVTYEGDEYPDFIAFGNDALEFGIQKASSPNDPPSVLIWQLGVSDIEVAADLCRKAAPQTIGSNYPAASAHGPASICATVAGGSA